MSGSPVGISAFKGPPGAKTPHHAFVTGITGSGKSVFLNDFLVQIDPFAHKVIVVDNGLSYVATLAALSGGKCVPFAPDVNGSQTLNYLDPGGLPLTPLFHNSAVGVLHRMAGRRGDQDADFLRAAVLSTCVKRFLSDWAGRWLEREADRRRRVHELRENLRRYAASTGHDGDLAELYSEFCSSKVGQGETNTDTQSSPSDGKPVRDLGRDADLAFAFMGRDEVPTHSDFHDWLEKRADEPGRDREELARLATLLEVWRCDRGTMGTLFDGTNTVDLDAPYVHIELGRIADADERVRSLVSFLISHKVIGSLLRLPRSQRKHVVLEELGSFLGVEGAEEMVNDFYQRARKYNAWVVGVIQQVSSLPADLATTVLGNCRQASLFRQEQPTDVALLKDLLRLPGPMAELLASFGEPSAQTGAPFLYWERGQGAPRVTAALNVPGPEVLYAADSGGAAFEKRRRALAGYDDVVGGIAAEAAKLAKEE